MGGDEFWENGGGQFKWQGSRKKSHIGTRMEERAWAVARGPTIISYNNIVCQY